MLIVKAVPSFIEQLLYAKAVLNNSSNKTHEVCIIIIPILHINRWWLREISFPQITPSVTDKARTRTYAV